MHERLVLLWLLFAALLVACGGNELEELPAEELVAKSAAAMSDLDGFRYVIDRTGAPAFLDNDETISFRRAEGYYVAPDRSQATVRIITPGLVTEVNVISIDETQWQTNVMSTEWEQLPPNWGFNPAVLFDADIGIQSILAADLNGMQVLEPERLEDGPEETLYVIEGALDGGRIQQMSYGLIGPEALTARLWIMPESFELVRAVITEANSGEEEPSVWQVEFSELGRVVDIRPPAG